jgi:tRNA threonylcarbamoyladenosine biosynthesis protein TsaB
MSAFRTILAIDSSLNGCSVAVCGVRGIFALAEPMAGGQAERLMPMIANVLEDAGLAYNDLEAVVTSVGPGAFTGLRIGLSTAKAFAMSLERPLYGLTTFQAIAFSFCEHDAKQGFAVIIETKRSDFYWQRFDSAAQPITPPRASEAQEIEAALDPGEILIGDGAMRYAQQVDAERERCVRGGYELSDMACVLRRLQNAPVLPSLFTSEPAPLYLRPADVSTPKASHRTLARE